MCTAISDGALFGRTLDLEYSFCESVVVTPRNFVFHFLYEGDVAPHYAIIGIAHVSEGVPLYYDAMNEAGLAVAALNFPDNAVYFKPRADAHNVASFELIPWLLSKCQSVSEARELLLKSNITDDSFSAELKTTPLHFIIADREKSLTVESTEDGLRVYDNPFGVMTNSPKFEYQSTHLQSFAALSSHPLKNKLCPSVELSQYSRGMGALGLPGDFSSPSRFVRAVFAKFQATIKRDKMEEINRFFHVMDTVSIPEGCVKTENGDDVFTVYTSCADMDGFCYYFTTYEERKIRRVELQKCALDTEELSVFAIGER